MELETPSADELLEFGPSSTVVLALGDAVMGADCVRTLVGLDELGWVLEDR